MGCIIYQDSSIIHTLVPCFWCNFGETHGSFVKIQNFGSVSLKFDYECYKNSNMIS